MEITLDTNYCAGAILKLYYELFFVLINLWFISSSGVISIIESYLKALVLSKKTVGIKKGSGGIICTTSGLY